MKLIRSISGIRGIIGENFSSSIAAEYAKSFCSIQSETNPFIIARDTRNQGYEISQEIKDVIILPAGPMKYLVIDTKRTNKDPFYCESELNKISIVHKQN